MQNLASLSVSWDTISQVKFFQLDTMNLKILTQKEFEVEIKKIVKDKQPITFLDAILLFCEQKGLEVETAASLISPKMKSVIEGESIKARLIPNTKARLPLED